MTVEKFKTLAEMGIEDISEIEKFSTRQEGDMDILKIYFHRDPGEWFAKSKKFKFKRQVKTVRVNEGKVSYRETSESSPYFLRALTELEKLADEMHTAKGRKEILLDEIDHLEKVMERKIADIRRQIEEL
ncbi:DUF3461 family protein [Nitrincola sp.]|uniref:DUF3461 family protein n=1 Tax=Nitrincola sp. TaxID=1926584 RepID=UPI003A8CEC8A